MSSSVPFDAAFSECYFEGSHQTNLFESTSDTAGLAPKPGPEKLRPRRVPETLTARTSYTDTTSLLNRPMPSASHLVAEWEGYVTSIQDENFVALLRGISGEGVQGESEEAIIPLREIQGPNEDLLQVGALFRLCVSYEELSSGQIRRYTEIIFRRLPAYRQKDLDEARQRARELLNGLRVE